MLKNKPGLEVLHPYTFIQGFVIDLYLGCCVSDLDLDRTLTFPLGGGSVGGFGGIETKANLSAPA